MEILNLAKFVPEETKVEVENILNQKSKYLDRSAIKKYLQNGKFDSPLVLKDCLDQEMLIKDV